MAIALPASLTNALHRISSSINPSTGLAHPSDMEHSVKWLGDAIQEMDEAVHPDAIIKHLVSLGRIGERHAMEVATIYEALWCYIKGKGPFSS